MRQLYSSLMQINPSDDWLKTGWAGDSQTRTRLVDSVLYHVFVSKQCILCSALRHKGIHSPWNFRPRFCRLPPRSLAFCRAEAARWQLCSIIKGCLQNVNKNSIYIYYNNWSHFSCQKLLFLFFKAKLCSLNRLVTHECRQNIVSVKFLFLSRGLIRIHHKLKYIIYFSFSR